MAEATNKEKIAALVAKGIDPKSVGLTSRSKTADIDAALKNAGIVLGEDTEETTTEAISKVEASVPARTVEQRLASLEEVLAKIVALPAIGSQIGAAHISAPAPATPAVVAIPKAKAKQSVTFTTTNKSAPVRTFSKDEHGANFNDVADEFHKSNQKTIISRVADAKSSDAAA
jgi:hypothetical protein